jgi:peptidoglycan L-alanyl-D-glutamate endopeptidase CwlK
MFQFSQRSTNQMSGVDFRLIEIANLAIELTEIDFGIPQYGGLRTTDDQYSLYLDGKSKCDGTEHISMHQLGYALDVFAYVDGKASWEKEHLTKVALAMLQAAQILETPLHWGGFWQTFVDLPHFQLVEIE